MNAFVFQIVFKIKGRHYKTIEFSDFSSLCIYIESNENVRNGVYTARVEKRIVSSNNKIFLYEYRTDSIDTPLVKGG